MAEGSSPHRSSGPTHSATALGFTDDGGVWVKDETNNVGR
jgi:hypothetical protein